MGDAGCLVSKTDQILGICNGLDGDYDSIVATILEGGLIVQEISHKLLAKVGSLETRNTPASLLPYVNLASIESHLERTFVNLIEPRNLDISGNNSIANKI